MPNLQARSNALARWSVRETLFGLGRQPPEDLPRQQRRLLVLYAVCVWIYRFFLFLGIALLVYYAFFKASGVILFAIEIVWFILLPIWREMKEWWTMRHAIARTRRTILTAAIAAAGLAAMLVPWSSTVRIQGVALAENEYRLFAPRPGRIATISIGDRQHVRAGDVAVQLTAPDLEHENVQARRRIALTSARLQRIAGDEADLADRVVLEVELERNKARLAGLEAETARLEIRSPGDGIVRDLDQDLRPGEWIDETTPVARVVAGDTEQVVGYVDEDEVWRLSRGAAATFVPEDPTRPSRSGRVIDISPAGVRTIEQIYLASVYGGAVASDRTPEGEVKPRTGRHLVRVTLDGAQPLDRAERGTLHLTGARESIAAAMVRRILQVLVRELNA
jgi:putative peptide zinc metalloprotease protein